MSLCLQGGWPNHGKNDAICSAENRLKRRGGGMGRSNIQAAIGPLPTLRCQMC